MAPYSPREHRLCPTRESGAPPLITHWITGGTCLDRQRGNYHKCCTCEHRGHGVGAARILVPARAVTAPPVPRAVANRKPPKPAKNPQSPKRSKKS